MFRQRLQFYRSILLLADIVVLSCAWIAAYYLRFYLPVIPVTKGVAPLELYLTFLPLAITLSMITFYTMGPLPGPDSVPRPAFMAVGPGRDGRLSGPHRGHLLLSSPILLPGGVRLFPGHQHHGPAPDPVVAEPGVHQIQRRVHHQNPHRRGRRVGPADGRATQPAARVGRGGDRLPVRGSDQHQIRHRRHSGSGRLAVDQPGH